MVDSMMQDAHAVVDTIEPAIALLGLGLIAALVAKALRLNPIVGYIAIGAIISALGLEVGFKGPVVEALAEVGVMFLLFNLGLHFSLQRIREEAANIFGFGALQMLVAGGCFSAICLFVGLPTPIAIIMGFALGLSSTAVVIGLIRERDQEDCPVGRAAQSILIFQDIAAIMLLVAAGALGSAGAIAPALGIAGLKALAAFAVAVLIARTLIGPLFRLISRSGSGEIYTATALFIALAAGWATGAAGLSLTLGAFLGGMAVADSRYRVLVQTEIEVFRGLFLGFFFIWVGLRIDAQFLAQHWETVLTAATALIALKCAVNVFAALLNRWSVPGSIQLGFLLGQGSEFALVLLSLPAVVGMTDSGSLSVLVIAIAISLAATPAVSNLGRKLAGKLRRGSPDKKLKGDNAPVLIIGMGPSGRAVADALSGYGIGYVAFDSDNARFERALADGYHVHHAMTGDPRSWDAMGMAKRDVVVISPGNIGRVYELNPLVEERLPHVKRVIAVHGDEHVAQLKQVSVSPVNVRTPGGTEALINAVCAALGHERAKLEAINEEKAKAA